MEPFSLLAIVAAAGFVFHAVSGRNDKRGELSYSRDEVAKDKESLSRDETDFSTIEVLPEYRLAKTLVEHNFPLVFVTGGAGTGKSTFVRWITQQFKDEVLLAAPTGVAAINIGGATLHGLCQLPPAVILKTDIKKSRYRAMIQKARLLVIDEISMVNANLLDGVSAFFRLNREVDQAFGGLPVIMVGDLFQLPPVVDDESRDFFDAFYQGSARFYSARCLRNANYYGIELNKTFRQTDQDFVDVLTKIREGIEVRQCIAVLNAACVTETAPPVGAVWLSPRNAEVDARNISELNKIDAPERMYQGDIEGNFNRKRLPSPLQLVLKVGAQVMFTKNSSCWTNGSVGIVQALEADSIVVELEGRTVNVTRECWESYRYKWNTVKQRIEREVIGSYRQFPLMLGWAVTIHKSQGKTIERVHLDLAAGAFENGQTYVALSRCRSMAGLSLARPIQERDIRVDVEARGFYQQLREMIRRLPPHVLMQNLQDDGEQEGTGGRDA